MGEYGPWMASFEVRTYPGFFKVIDHFSVLSFPNTKAAME